MRNQISCVAIAFAAMFAVASVASAQPTGPVPVGPGPIGPGPVGAGPVGPGPVGPGPVGPGPMALAPIGPTPAALPSPPMLIGPMTIGRPMSAEWSEQDRQDREKEAEQRERDRETRLWDQGRDDMDNGRYDRAIQRFTDTAAMKGAHAENALYWKAWAQNKIGQRAESLATLASLAKDYPKGRYASQAKQLESEVRLSSGQPARPENENDEEMKSYALAALMNSDPERRFRQSRPFSRGRRRHA